DARGVISSSERQNYILRVRELAKAATHIYVSGLKA
ncbi:MAG: glycine--tRNA ligase subunit alpha, partial [Pseudomonadota bacterium]